MIKKDFSRRKSISIVVFSFIMLSALLLATGANLVVELSNSLNALFENARAPHFVQMHAGEIDQREIDRWSDAQELVVKQQTVEMINIDGSALFLGGSASAEVETVMDISFVTQNESFDFLLDSENRKQEVAPGEIGVPVYFMQKNGLKQGDQVRVAGDSLEMSFDVAGFTRDSQMNPALVHSKRFLVNPADFEQLAQGFHDREYLIEFRLNDADKVGDFSSLYSSSGLPDKGPAVDIAIFKVFNALTDGIAAGVVILLSLVLMIIALLCLRFIVLAAIEEDYREIGVMKAVGIAKKDIKRIFLVKYTALGVLASLPGYLLSLFINPLLLSNMFLYMGSAPKTVLQHLIPFAAAASISLMVLISCLIILRRFDRISAVEAFRSGSVGESANNRNILRLKKSRVLNVNIFLGFKDVFQRLRMFGLLWFVFFFCTCFILIPIHFLTTIESPSFISYMGIGKSDIRIDLRRSDDTAGRFKEMMTALNADRDVHALSPMATSRFTLLQSDGTEEHIDIEIGDFSIFPLDYQEGRAPERKNEIALSYKNSEEMGKSIGDKLTIISGGKEITMVLTGIYQDVTNGGRTAKAVLDFNKDDVLRYSLGLDLKAGVSIAEKVREYSALFHPARITGIQDYLHQTLGGTISQVRKVVLGALLTGLFVSVLITTLFMKMVIAKDGSRIAVMKSLGFSLSHIRVQYLMESLLLLLCGIIGGTIFSNVMGQELVSVLWGFMGASQISFVVNPLQSYLLFPLILTAAVLCTTLLTISDIKETSIISMIAE
ncbi:MAG: ABC transporter permease [Spirochaetales bacterium]|nr:ABC transporter permease [Spirochaetales bacterium]